MKKWIVLLLACMLCLPVASAAQWGDGLSAAQPYDGVAPVDLTQSMGHVLMFPTAKLPAEHYCDVLEIYLPREDVELASGGLRLSDEDGLVAEVDFVDAQSVALRPMTEEELNGLVWGGGVCIEAHLPVSLEFGKSYRVNMDEGCFTAADGGVPSPAIQADDAWTPVFSGDYGVGGLRYSAAGAEGDAEAEITATPGPGDRIDFQLLLGGEAVGAGIYCDNGSVAFETVDYSASGAVSGEVTGDAVSWGVVFFNAEGEIIDAFDFTR